MRMDDRLLKALSTHATTSVGVSDEVIIWKPQPLLTPHRIMYFNGFN